MPEPSVPSYPAAERIKEWLRRAGFELAVPPLEAGLAWALVFTGDSGIPVLVCARSSDPAAPLIQIRMGAAPQQIAQLDRLRRAREDFVRALRSLLLKHHVEFELVPERGVVVARQLYSDGLSEDRFWRDVTAVRCAALDAMLHYEQHLGGGALPAEAFLKPN